MKIDYGIKEIVFTRLAEDGKFPNFTTATDKISISMVDLDSFNMDEQANETADVDFENTDTLTLPGKKGKKIITFTSSDKGEEMAIFFRGMKKVEDSGENAGYLVENPNHDDSGTFAMMVVTRPLGKYPAKQKEFTPVLVTVKETGTIGKNNLGRYSFECVRQPNFDAAGTQIAGYREKEIKEA